MKHTWKITLILLGMFLITQLIGLTVVKYYTQGYKLPYGMEPPKEVKEKPKGAEIITAFVFAIFLFFILLKFDADFLIRLWFFSVTALAIGITVNIFLVIFSVPSPSIIAAVIGITLSYLKVYKRHLLVHNLTEFLIYPGIAAVFVSMLDMFWTVLILLLISLYDIWAVWHTDFMKKMATYQINNLRLFTGFFVPYLSKKQRIKLKLLKQKYSHDEKKLEEKLKKEKIQVSLAILGGGDIIFPIIAAGVFYKTILKKNILLYLSLNPPLTAFLLAALISLSSTLSLFFLFVYSKKGEFYPAMPFLTIGIYLGILFSLLIDSLFIGLL